MLILLDAIIFPFFLKLYLLSQFLLLTSSAATAIGQIVLATFLQCKQLGIDMQSFAVVPVLSFAWIVFAANWGVSTVPFVLIAEVMPDRLRSLGLSLSLTLIYTMGFALLLGFPMLVTAVGMAGSLYTFAGCTIVGAAFVGVAVPETRGLSFEAIRQIMEK